MKVASYILLLFLEKCSIKIGTFNASMSDMNEKQIITNKELNIYEALIPVVFLVGLLAFNVYVFGDNALSGSNQFVL